MRGGRHSDHHSQALTRLAAALLVAGGLAALGSEALAAERKIALDGTVHRVSTRTPEGEDSGLALSIVHVREPASGERMTSVVPGTEHGWNREPTLEIDPVTDQPVVLWSRREPSGFDLFLSRFDGNVWSPAAAVVTGGGDDVQPQVRISGNLIHVVWKRLVDTHPAPMRLSLDRATLTPVVGPESLPITDVQPFPAPGTDSPCGPFAPSLEETFFGVAIGGAVPEAPGEVFVFGIRDEPMPVGFRQGFEVPASLEAAEECSAAWIADHFVLWFVSSGRLYYTILDGGRWCELRSIALDPPGSTAEALEAIEEMLLRTESEGGG